jgi:hypothetical protein
MDPNPKGHGFHPSKTSVSPSMPLSIFGLRLHQTVAAHLRQPSGVFGMICKHISHPLPAEGSLVKHSEETEAFLRNPTAWFSKDKMFALVSRSCGAILCTLRTL